MRLAKYIAHAGIASRRAAEELVFEGRVTVDGNVVTDPARDVDSGNAVTVDGDRIAQEETIVYIVNKPLGVISPASDPEGRKTVVDLVGNEKRLYPVGRLDANSSGLMLVTNDGELANRLSHPRYGVPKRYRVRLRRGSPLRRNEIEHLERGVMLDDGMTGRAEVTKTGTREFEIVISEGRNRQIRRMLEAIGRDVGELERIEFGGLELGRLKGGTVRRLSPEEVQSLWQNVPDQIPAGPKRKKPAAKKRRTSTSTGDAKPTPGSRRSRAKADPSKQAPAKRTAKAAPANTPKAKAIAARSGKAKSSTGGRGPAKRSPAKSSTARQSSPRGRGSK
ncbi:MAG TPA: pseudouridine synthase [Solirubrobacterales bacterium]|nr:pseudouridine synthase [Solirubrobacterales bacterium]